MSKRSPTAPLRSKNRESNGRNAPSCSSGVILGSLLLGLAQLTVKFHLRPKANVTLLSQITQRAVGHGATYYIVELATTVALALAANTSYGGLPVLASLLAGDSFLPRVFALHGERTVYRYGVVVLAVLAGLLIVGSGGNTQTLIPLYAIGVFIGFTLAQTGLVRHWFTHHGHLWAVRAAINGTGAVLSGAAAVIFLATKFIHGAFITVVVIPALMVMFRKIHRYYDTLGAEFGLDEEPPQPDGRCAGPGPRPRRRPVPAHLRPPRPRPGHRRRGAGPPRRLRR